MTEHQRQAIVDIGSNSIRLVVFGGPPRAPVALFNEKLMAGLGRGVVAGGRLDPANVAAALKSLARFAAMLDLMQPIAVRAVATAAVRDAADGAEFLDRVRALGLPAELLDGDGEAVAAGYGVIAALPEADGLVADLGGGSLELVRVANGEVHERVSLPFGAMRIAAIRAGGTGRLRKALRKAVAEHSWLAACAGKPLYCVGGAWRTLARVQMHLSGWPLAVLGNYTFPAAAARDLKATVREMGPVALAALSGVSSARAIQLDDAAALLAALTAEVAPGSVVISAFGLREGLLYQALTPAQRARDPLVDGVTYAVGSQQQVAGYAEALLAWSDAAFPGEPPADRRLRYAACLLAGTGWASNPAFRAVAGEDLALHGAWVGVDSADRAVMAMALHVGLGGDPDSVPTMLARIAPVARLAQARAWGLAIRLAQRLSGGAPQALAALPLELADDGALVLSVPQSAAALLDPAAERRLDRLGLALERNARIESRPAGAYPPKKRGRTTGRR